MLVTSTSAVLAPTRFDLAMPLLQDAKYLRDFALRNSVILRHFDARLKPDLELAGRCLDLAWKQVVRPVMVGEQRAAALRFDDPRVQAPFAAIVLFLFQTDRFTTKQLRAPVAHLLGLDPATITAVG